MKRRGGKPAQLRARAERQLAEAPASPRPVGGSGEDLHRLLHELQVHQVELELQNEELVGSRTEIEELLRRYTELFDHAPIGYLHVDAVGRITRANFSAARLLDAPRGLLVGRSVASFVAERDQRRLQAFLAGLLTRSEEEVPAATGEFALNRTTGGALDVQLTGALLAGPVPSALLAAEDVTARRRAERQLAAEAERKDQFLAALSHELRNPLAPIRNALPLLRRMVPDSPPAERCLTVIDRQVTHLTRMVEDLLDVTRIARGRVELRRERVDLGSQVARTVEDHRATFDAAGVELACDLSKGPCWVDADPARLAQVLGNLLGNAVKFTGRGGRVDVRVDRAGGRAMLRVLDDGVGIPQDVIGHVFEPFTQAPQTLERTRGGLGLGLAMVKGLVELHGGTVEVRSAGAGSGAEFVVKLPLAQGGPAARTAHGPVTLGPPRRVLIIDDNEDAATTLQDLLTLAGHEVRTALDGPAGLQEAGRFYPELVICDIGLPTLDGYGVARALRSGEACPGAWLVAMSGYATREDAERSRQAGFDRHVAKPASVERLEAIFAEAPSQPRDSGGPAQP
ncbi:MAG: ATP-binding protein [Anaeromyxobacter sp.]